MNATLKFAFLNETKGAVRYQEVGDDGAPAFAPKVSGRTSITRWMFTGTRKACSSSLIRSRASACWQSMVAWSVARGLL